VQLDAHYEQARFVQACWLSRLKWPVQQGFAGKEHTNKEPDAFTAANFWQAEPVTVETFQLV